LKEEALYRTLRRTRFGRWQKTEWKSGTWNSDIKS